jgi:aminoglycoside phosphotransferase (APT) family kinase protein
VPLIERDAATQAAIDASVGLIDVDVVRRIWHDALKVPVWSAPGVWVHGDLAPGNVLVHDGHLAAVIDFGGLGVGDPAVDMLIAWNYLSPRARQRFRQTVAVDEATWLRGRAWALSVAIIQLPYYYHSNPTVRDNALHTLDAVMRDE